ncbi:unknown [Firmicutes bacterium CAG:555]|nr:unknown [Firmicutes bacterium CAG:555]
MIVRNDAVLWDNGRERLYIFEMPPESCCIADQP